MGLPIVLPLLQIEIKGLPKADTSPTPPEGYKVVLIEDLSYTKLWMIYKLIE